MTEKTDYNGWTNHATWAVRLHWDNNEGDYKYFMEQAERFYSRNRSVCEFADFLKETYEEIHENVVMRGEGTQEARYMVSDVGNGSDVDWYEIAESYYNEIEEDRKVQSEEVQE